MLELVLDYGRPPEMIPLLYNKYILTSVRDKETKGLQ